jgi:hypothetical protein
MMPPTLCGLRKHPGGKDNFAVDRAVAAEAVKKMGDDDRPRRPPGVRGR